MVIINKLTNNKTISISILDVKDVKSFLSNLNIIQKKHNLDNIIIHFDVMDGEFVPSIGVNLDFIKLAHEYDFFTDVHLMVSKPEEYIYKACKLGADNITIHYEIDDLYKNLEILNKIKEEKNKKAELFSVGISIKPETDVKKIKSYISLCDVILIMSVEPGYGGQTYMSDVNSKILDAKSLKKILQIDGGINNGTISASNELGINSFVIGSYFTKNLDILEERILQIEKMIGV